MPSPQGGADGGRGRRAVFSWCLFDFANSTYAAVVSAVVFPVFYTESIVTGGGGELWWGRAISISMIIVALSSPFMGGVADYGGYRKRLLMLYTWSAVAAVALFSLLKPGMALYGMLLVIVGNIGVEGGMVFYNSFLPVISGRRFGGRVSSWGFAVGYAGSILSLLIALPLVRAGRYDATWLMVAALFFLFSLPAFLFLPPDRGGMGFGEAARLGLRETVETFREVLGLRDARRFLLAYFIYIDGVNTVIVFSSIFASATLGFEPLELVILYLVVQVTALLGAMAMSRPVDFRGPRQVVLFSLLLWLGVSVSASLVETKEAFWAIACLAGLGLGTVQAASRAFFAQYIPEGDESKYFGIYSMMGKTSAILGPWLFGVVSTAFGSQRPAVLMVSIFFGAGILLLLGVRGGGPNDYRGSAGK